MEIFKLFGTILVDSSEAQKSISKTGEQASKLGETFLEGIGTVAKWGAALVGAGATAVGAITKQSAELYAEYEQLVGGVETLFGTSQEKVQEYANNAFRTAGMSANEYMETVTSFSASLLQGLGNDTEKAADYADRAITDMADNANKMGTDISSIQNAYQGFAKQNYTMLDNLKLGYGGTKNEMERPIKDASQMTEEMTALGISVDADSMSFDNIINAISVMQTHMGIAGTTSKEAAQTISGSISAMKSSWENLLTGLGEDGADVEMLVGNLVDSAVTVMNNLMPRIVQILEGIGTMIETAVPAFAEKLPAIVQQLLPKLLVGATKLVASLIQNLPAFIKSIIDSIVSLFKQYWPSIKQAGTDLLNSLWDGIEEVWNKLKTWFEDKIKWISDKLAVWSSNKVQAEETADLLGRSSSEINKYYDSSNASGLNYVPYDGYTAELHRGEAVMNAGQMNRLLSAIESMSSEQPKENSSPINLQLNIDGKAFAKATYSNYVAEGKRVGTSLVGA